MLGTLLGWIFGSFAAFIALGYCLSILLEIWKQVEQNRPWRNGREAHVVLFLDIVATLATLVGLLWKVAAIPPP